MNAHALIHSLEHFPPILAHAIFGMSSEDLRWRPDDGGWSLTEILAHMVDEETDDFRRRLGLLLESAATPWPPIDPPKWVTERHYNDREAWEMAHRFAEERKISVAWLRGLANPDWEATYAHPSGPIKAGDLLVSWAAHDALHLRQIGKRLHQLATRDGAGYSPKYAGEL